MPLKKTNQELFELYGRVQKGDRDAIEELRSLYLERFPKNRENIEYNLKMNRKWVLHVMYLHLTRGSKSKRK